MTLRLFAIAAPGVEGLVAGELASLGIAGAVEDGGVSWQGTVEQLYAANLHLRTASRIVVRIGEFRSRTFWELERHADKLPWERFVTGGRPVQLRVTSRKSKLYHQRAVAERVLAAIQRRIGVLEVAPTGDDEETEGAAAQLFIVRFLHDRCTVSADASGALLHLRGYRQALARAPLRETLAATLLLASGWTGHSPLLDPMCGSGTIPIEAALMARRIAPGLAGGEPRAYAFQEWPDFESETWTRVVEHASAQVLPSAGVPIVGSDRDAGAIEAARANAARAGVLGDLSLEVRPVSALEPPPGAGWMVSNPPYGVRVGETDRLRNLYAALGATARARLPGWTLALLSANRELEAQLRIPLTETLRTRNGGIPVRVVVGRVGGAGATASDPPSS